MTTDLPLADEHISLADHVADFVQEATQVKVGQFISFRELYPLYREWCFEHGIRRPLERPMMQTSMLEKDIARGTNAEGDRGLADRRLGGSWHRARLERQAKASVDF